MSVLYEWRVRTMAGVERSGWSEVRTFTVNDLMSPPVAWYFTISTPILSWTTAASANLYEITIDDGNLATPPLVYTTTNLSHMLPALMDGSYTYKVRARLNANVWTDSTALDSFVVDVR